MEPVPPKGETGERVMQEGDGAHDEVVTNCKGSCQNKRRNIVQQYLNTMIFLFFFDAYIL